MSERDRIIFCPNCNTRQNFNFSSDIGVCMACSHEVARNVQKLSALALYEYEEEEKLKRAIKGKLYGILKEVYDERIK